MIKISKIFGDFVPRDPAFARTFSRRSAILKIVEEKALGTRLLTYSPGFTPHFALENRTLSDAFAFEVQWMLSLFAFVIIHQGHKRKEINLRLAAFIDPPLEN